MKNNFMTGLLVVVIVSLFAAAYLFLNSLHPLNLVSPAVSQMLNSTPSSTPSPTPVDFHFDHNTDLKQELNSIDPQLQDPNIDRVGQLVQAL